MNSKDKAEAKRIRDRYLGRHDRMEELRKLDAKVQRPAIVFGMVFGILAALILGSGMCLVMTDIGFLLGISNGMPLGIVIGVVGLIMAIINYPIYRAILKARREEYAPRIVSLSDRILGFFGL